MVARVIGRIDRAGQDARRPVAYARCRGSRVACGGASGSAQGRTGWAAWHPDGVELREALGAAATLARRRKPPSKPRQLVGAAVHGVGLLLMLATGCPVTIPAVPRFWLANAWLGATLLVASSFILRPFRAAPRSGWTYALWVGLAALFALSWVVAPP